MQGQSRPLCGCELWMIKFPVLSRCQNAFVSIKRLQAQVPFASHPLVKIKAVNHRFFFFGFFDELGQGCQVL